MNGKNITSAILFVVNFTQYVEILIHIGGHNDSKIVTQKDRKKGS